MDIERLRQAVIDKRFILSANPDWRAGRACGLSDDETGQKANDALAIILENIAEVVVAYLIDDRQSVKNEEVHLCNDCEYGCMAACPITKNIKFGNGRGNDNVIECENYINKEALKKWRINKTLEQEG